MMADSKGAEMKCPHCTVSIHEAWSLNRIADNAYTDWYVRVMMCPACSNNILQLGVGASDSMKSFSPSTWTLIHPNGSSRGPVPEDVPSEIAEDYNQAALVLPLSPKASAALSRRCLQHVLTEAGYKQRDLVEQIDAALNESDTRRALPSAVHMTLDAIRNFGNFSAHVITDKTTLQIIDVEPNEAEYCLDILDRVFDHYYVKPGEAARLKAELDLKLKSAGKPASK